MKRTLLAHSYCCCRPRPAGPRPKRHRQHSLRHLNSPEVHADNSVTFRFLDPNAHEVMLTLEGAKPAPMQKDDQGVWSFTTGPLDAGHLRLLVRGRWRQPD